ncbi:MAG: hypothetical protein KF847_19590 [Pirellulales bacterium]|nr:hypothetical protein [Pirellulales bacterium]
MTNDSQAPSSRGERWHCSAAQKVALVTRHLLDKDPVSDLCDEASITPKQFHQRQKQFLEGVAAAFEPKKSGKLAGPSPVERRAAHLEQWLALKQRSDR